MKALRIIATCSLSIMLLTQSVHALDDNTLVGFVTEIVETGEDKDQNLIQHIYKLIKDDDEAQTARLVAQGKDRWKGLLKKKTPRYPKLALLGEEAIKDELKKLLKEHEPFISGAGVSMGGL